MDTNGAVFHMTMLVYSVLGVLSWFIATRDVTTPRQAFKIAVITPFVIELALWLLKLK